MVQYPPWSVAFVGTAEAWWPRRSLAETPDRVFASFPVGDGAAVGRQDGADFACPVEHGADDAGAEDGGDALGHRLEVLEGDTGRGSFCSFLDWAGCLVEVEA